MTTTQYPAQGQVDQLLEEIQAGRWRPEPAERDLAQELVLLAELADPRESAIDPDDVRAAIKRAGPSAVGRLIRVLAPATATIDLPTMRSDERGQELVAHMVALLRAAAGC